MWKKLLMLVAVLSVVLVATDLLAQGLPEVHLKLLTDPPDTVQLGGQIKVTITIWNAEDTSVVVLSHDYFWEPGGWGPIARDIWIPIDAGKDTTYAGIGSPHPADDLGTWYFGASISYSGGIIDRDFKTVVVVE